MELLNLLEERVHALLRQNEHLREENRRMAASSAGSVQAVQELQEENRLLQESLAQEQRLKDEVLHRIDALLASLKDIELKDTEQDV